MRTSDKIHFPEVKTFREFKKNGNLAGKSEVGREIYDIDHNSLIESGSILDLDEYRYSRQTVHTIPQTY